MKTFIRTEHSNSKIECSWYDKNGRRYLHRFSSLSYLGKSVKETDNATGYMAYARKNEFNIIDNFDGEHPKRLNKEEE